MSGEEDGERDARLTLPCGFLRKGVARQDDRCSQSACIEFGQDPRASEHSEREGGRRDNDRGFFAIDFWTARRWHWNRLERR